MLRRSYLCVVGSVAALSGCAGGGADSEDAASTTTDPPPTTATSSKSSGGGSARFEVVSVDAPERVQVGEEHRYEITIRNVGDQRGTFEADVEITTADATRWEEVGTIEIQDIPPGETRTFTTGSASFDRPYKLRYRMPEYGVEWGYDVVAPQPAITLGESSLVVVDVGYETRPMAGVIVINEGDAPTKRVPVTADWLDSSGTYIASSEASVRALKPGETWSARVDPLADVEDYGTIDDFEGSVGNVQPALSLDPDGVTLVDDQLRASESEVLVRGAVRNERDSALQYIEVVAKVYDAAGDVIGLAWTNERDLGAGDQLRFEVNPDTKGRNGDVESHEVVLAESSLSI